MYRLHQRERGIYKTPKSCKKKITAKLEYELKIARVH